MDVVRILLEAAAGAEAYADACVADADNCLKVAEMCKQIAAEGRALTDAEQVAADLFADAMIRSLKRRNDAIDSVATGTLVIKNAILASQAKRN